MTEPKKSMIRKLFLRSFALEIKVFRLRGRGHHQATPRSVKFRDTDICSVESSCKLHAYCIFQHVTGVVRSLGYDHK